MKNNDIAIIGCGNAGIAVGADLARRGYNVRLYNRTSENISCWRDTKKVYIFGAYEAKTEFVEIGNDIEEIVKKCDRIIIATPALAHAQVARKIAPFLNKGHHIMLLSGKMGGCLEFEKEIKESGFIQPASIVEGDAIFACRRKEGNIVQIRGKKEWVLVAGSTPWATKNGLTAFGELYDSYTPADNPIQRGLSDLGAYVHPVVMICNMGSIERGYSFLFYKQGVTPLIKNILDALEKERQQIAKAFNTKVKSMVDMVCSYYPKTPNCYGDIMETLQKCPTYQQSLVPATLNHRYILEDILTSLVPTSQLAKIAKVFCPTLNAVIDISSASLGRNFRKEGRDCEKLGLTNIANSLISSTKSVLQIANNLSARF